MIDIYKCTICRMRLVDIKTGFDYARTLTETERNDKVSTSVSARLYLCNYDKSYLPHSDILMELAYDVSDILSNKSLFGNMNIVIVNKGDSAVRVYFDSVVMGETEQVDASKITRYPNPAYTARKYMCFNVTI